MEKITFLPDGDEPVEFFVLEQTRISGVNYILVTDTEDGDGEALILKDLAEPQQTESLYEIVSEDVELQAVAKVFENMLEGIEFVEEEER